MTVKFGDKVCTLATSFSARVRCFSLLRVKIQKAMDLCEQKIRRNKSNRIRWAKKLIMDSENEHAHIYVLNPSQVQKKMSMTPAWSIQNRTECNTQ